MTPYGILAIVSLALLGLAYIALVIAALRVCAWSATGIMFLNPFSVIPFIITHWGKAKYAVYLALGAAAFMLAAIGVQQIIQTDQVLGGEEVGFELTMPKGWNVRQNLKKGAVIQMSRPTTGLYFVAFATDRNKNDATNPDGAANDAVKEIAADLGVSTIDPCKPILLDGSRACVYAISGCSKKDRCFVYTITTIDADDHLLHLVGWTPVKRKEENMPVLLMVRDSFSWFVKDGRKRLRENRESVKEIGSSRRLKGR